MLNQIIQSVGAPRLVKGLLLIILVIFGFFVAEVLRPDTAVAAPVSPGDQALLRALERQATAQEDLAATLKAIEKRLGELATKAPKP